MTVHGVGVRCLPALVAFCLFLLLPDAASAQGRGNAGGAQAPPTVELAVDVVAQVREFYGSRASTGVRALPPGIRRRLERGKPLPPGIAKQVAPGALLDRIDLPRGFELLEVGVDVLLVEAATGIIHDLLMDVIR